MLPCVFSYETQRIEEERLWEILGRFNACKPFVTCCYIINAIAGFLLFITYYLNWSIQRLHSELAIIFRKQIWIRYLWNQAGLNNVTVHRLKKLFGYIATVSIKGFHTLSRSTSSSLILQWLLTGYSLTRTAGKHVNCSKSREVTEREAKHCHRFPPLDTAHYFVFVWMFVKEAVMEPCVLILDRLVCGERNMAGVGEQGRKHCVNVIVM